MIWHLIAVVIVGVSTGGIMFALRKLSRNRIPKGLIPIAASLAMFWYLAYYDYSWYEFKASLLPDDAVIVSTQQTKSPFRPWSYVRAPVNVFTVFDGNARTIRQDDQIIVEYYLYTFYNTSAEGVKTWSNLLNCTLMERVFFDKDQPEATMRVEKVSYSDEMYRRLCP